MKVSLKTCENDLYPLLSEAGRSELTRWENERPTRVVEFAKSLTHQHLFEIQPEDVLEVASRTEHALGDVRKQEALSEIEDYSAPFSFQDIFHGCVEANEGLPTWAQFREWFAVTRPDLFIEDYFRDIRPGKRNQEERKKLKRALKWRMGKAYYSALREVHLLACLRHRHGLNVKYHVLADVRLRVDFWIENQIIICYFSNADYRAGSHGRKPATQKFFENGITNFHTVRMDNTREFGKVWLVDDSEIEMLADSLSKNLSIA